MRHFIARYAAPAIATLGLGILAGFYVSSLISSDPYDPLGQYPVQELVGVVRDSSGTPTVRIGETIPVRGVKCNETEQDVDVRGTVFWHPLSPGGESFKAGEGEGVRTPGCETFFFQNEIPDEVADRVRGVGPSLYEITGTETPIAPDGDDGVPRTWRTEAFLIQGG